MAAKAENRIRIDVHHHVMPPNYVRRRRASIAELMPTHVYAIDWQPHWSLEQMDKAGVDTVVLSVSTPGVWFGDDAEACEIARDCNEFCAGLKRDHPGRFGFFSATPLPCVDGALEEIAFALDRLGADGVGLLSSHGERWLGDPLFQPMFEELNRRSAVVYVHPTAAECCRGLVPGVAPAAVEFPFDTTRTITSMLLGQVFTRYPNIRFIFSHGGGALPMLAGRISAFARQVADGPAIFRTLYYDTASVTNPISFTALRGIARLDHILFGTDYPYGAIDGTLEALRALDIRPADLRGIEGEFALALFPQFGRDATAASPPKSDRVMAP